MSIQVQQSSVRQPRALVRVNGVALTGWISWEVHTNTFYEADTFRVSFASTAIDSSSIVNSTQVFVEILAGFPSDPQNINPAELQSLIYGQVDEIELDQSDRLLTLTGRDLTALFIDNKLSAQYQNLTASQIATTLANARGLTPVVTKTKRTAGTIYKIDQVTLQANQSEWDLLAMLARDEGMVVYVRGLELHFEPNPTSTTEPYLITWTQPTDQYASPRSSVQHLSFSRTLTVSRGITVTVRSDNLNGKNAVVEGYPSKAKPIQAGKATTFGGVQNYFFKLPAGSTPQQCQLAAQQRYHEIVSHEMKLRATLPGDNVLTTTAPIQVVGTGSGFDQLYYPHSITREMSLDMGYTMTVEAKNKNPNNQATA